MATLPAVSVTEVPIGHDRFQAQVIADTCATEGIYSELLFADTNPYNDLLRAPNRLVVQTDDVSRVIEIAHDLYPDLREPHEPMSLAKTALQITAIVIAIFAIFTILWLLNS